MLSKRRSSIRLAVAVLLVVLLVAAAVAFAVAYRPAIAAVPRPDTRTFPFDEVAKGEQLARIGDCATCHTASGGRPYAGGLPLSTPFGTLFATNITPDVGTGIGTWSQDAFRRAMREGVSRDGSHLYPAFPYEHFTNVTDVDLDALYAYLMTREAVSETPPENRLIPPLGFRPLLAAWKLLSLRRGAEQPESGQSAEWNRGAYLVEGLGHCGGCHTPRNVLGAERRGEAYAGGWAEGWYAPAINTSSPAKRAWTVERLATYLRTGLDTNHAAAAGPMGPVTHELARASEPDVHAIAVYVASLMGAATVKPESPVSRAIEAGQRHPQGAALFAGACAGCHAPGAPMTVQGRPDLSLGSPVHEDDPRDALQIILQGLRPPVAARGPAMPAFGSMLSDAQVSEIARYVRTRYSTQPEWPELEAAVATARKEGATR